MSTAACRKALREGRAERGQTARCSDEGEECIGENEGWWSRRGMNLITQAVETSGRKQPLAASGGRGAPCSVLL